MNKDPIVEEVRAVRDAIAREHNYDLDSIFDMLCEIKANSGRTYVSPPPASVEPLPIAAQQAIVADEPTPHR